MLGSPPWIQVSSKTCVQRVNKDLFDFEASGADVQCESYSVNGAGACVRTGEHFSCVGAGTLARIQSKSRPLFKFEGREQQIALTPAEPTSNPSSKSRPWVVVKESPLSTAKISVGDEILMGRASLVVAQVVTDSQSSEAPRVREQSVCEICDPGASDTMQCRICLMDGCSEENPFVQPCLCRGSVASVHLDCLRQWTKTRLKLSEAPVESFVYKTPICEMCRAQYPALICTGEQTEPLVDTLPAVQAPYLVLRSSTRSDKSRPKERQTCYHTVSFAQKPEAKVGRGKEATVRVEDISMSRWHATLKFKDGEFTVEDHDSKFGTLLAMQKPWALGSGQALSVKVGRSVFSFSLPPEAPSTSAEARERAASSERAEGSPCSAESEGKASAEEREGRAARRPAPAAQSSCLPLRRGLLRLLPERLLLCLG